MKNIYVADLKHGDIIQDGLFRIISYDKQTGRTGSAYIKIGLQDKTGKIDGKIWSNAFALCAESKTGDIVRLSGVIDTYNNNLQVIISKLSIEASYDIDDYLQTSKRKGEDIIQEIEGYIAQMQSRYLRTFLETQLHDSEFRKKFMTFPAAKSIHHAYISGLAEHVLDMLHMSEPILIAHPLANRDIIYTGIILHDIGKLVEFEEKNNTYDYSLEGTMLGHIFIGANWFNQHIPDDFPEDLRIRITHIILSHHGKKELGSPVKPKTYEAIIVNRLDDMSYMLNTIQYAYEGYNGVNDYSEKLISLDNDQVYLVPYSSI